MAGTVVADQLEAASTSTLVLKNGVANTPPTVQDSAGTQIGTFCRAWVNFNGTGTVAIRASFNVTSITDNGTGDYTVNFTTAMSDANYAVSGWVRTTGGASFILTQNTSSTLSTSSIRLATGYSTVIADVDTATVAIFR